MTYAPRRWRPGTVRCAANQGGLRGPSGPTAPTHRDRPERSRPPTTARRSGGRRRASRRAAAETSLLFDDIVKIAEPSQSGQRLVHPLIVGKVFGVAVQKPPVAAGERARAIADSLAGPVFAFPAVVAHPIDVGAARGIRLGRH